MSNNKYSSGGWRRRDIIASLRMSVVLATLVGAVVGAHSLLGLRSGLSIIVGILVGYPFARVIDRYAFPEVKQMSDIELSHINLVARWTVLSLLMALSCYFIAGVQWEWSGLVAIFIGWLGFVVDRRKQLNAQSVDGN